MKDPCSERGTAVLYRAFDHARFVWDFFIARQDKPFILGLAITDICNRACKHCRVVNIEHQSMTLENVDAHLIEQDQQGIRYLYWEGGAPYLWRDGEHQLRDIVQLVRQIGYFRVQVYTNGTVTLDSSPDFSH